MAEASYRGRARNPAVAAMHRSTIIDQLRSKQLKPLLKECNVMENIKVAIDEIREECEKAEIARQGVLINMETQDATATAAEPDDAFTITESELKAQALCRFFDKTSLPTMEEQSESQAELSEAILGESIVALLIALGRRFDLEIFSCASMSCADWLLCSVHMGFSDIVEIGLEAVATYQANLFGKLVKKNPDLFFNANLIGSSWDDVIPDANTSPDYFDALGFPTANLFEQARIARDSVKESDINNTYVQLYSSVMKNSQTKPTTSDGGPVFYTNPNDISDVPSLLVKALSASAFQTVPIHPESFNDGQVAKIGLIKLPLCPETSLTIKELALQFLFTPWQVILIPVSPKFAKTTRVSPQTSWLINSRDGFISEEELAFAASESAAAAALPRSSSVTTTTTTTTVKEVGSDGENEEAPDDTILKPAISKKLVPLPKKSPSNASPTTKMTPTKSKDAPVVKKEVTAKPPPTKSSTEKKTAVVKEKVAAAVAKPNPPAKVTNKKKPPVTIPDDDDDDDIEDKETEDRMDVTAEDEGVGKKKIDKPALSFLSLIQKAQEENDAAALLKEKKNKKRKRKTGDEGEDGDSSDEVEEDDAAAEAKADKAYKKFCAKNGISADANDDDLDLICPDDEIDGRKVKGPVKKFQLPKEFCRPSPVAKILFGGIPTKELKINKENGKLEFGKVLEKKKEGQIKADNSNSDEEDVKPVFGKKTQPKTDEKDDQKSSKTKGKEESNKDFLDLIKKPPSALKLAAANRKSAGDDFVAADEDDDDDEDDVGYHPDNEDESGDGLGSGGEDFDDEMSQEAPTKRRKMEESDSEAEQLPIEHIYRFSDKYQTKPSDLFYALHAFLLFSNSSLTKEKRDEILDDWNETDEKLLPEFLETRLKLGSDEKARLEVVEFCDVFFSTVPDEGTTHDKEYVNLFDAYAEIPVPFKTDKDHFDMVLEHVNTMRTTLSDETKARLAGIRNPWRRKEATQSDFWQLFVKKQTLAKFLLLIFKI